MSLKSDIDNIIIDEYNNPTGQLGENINDYLEENGYNSLKPDQIALFNNWQQEPYINGWQDLVDWFWSKVKQFIEWLWDLIN